MNIAFPYKKFTFSLIPQGPIMIPAYKGSTLRGGFGNAFKKVVCAVRQNECRNCLLSQKCIYSYVFETPPPLDTKIMRKYKAAPHPFIIEPPLEKRQCYTPHDEITFGLTLIGKAVDYLPYFIYTFDELGKMGIGKGRGKYDLKAVGAYCNTPFNGSGGSRTTLLEDTANHTGKEIIYSAETKILKPFEHSVLNLELGMLNQGEAAPSHYVLTLNFLTPTRIIYDSHLTLNLEFHMLIRQLLRRIFAPCIFPQRD